MLILSIVQSNAVLDLYSIHIFAFPSTLSFFPLSLSLTLLMYSSIA